MDDLHPSETSIEVEPAHHPPYPSTIEQPSGRPSAGQPDGGAAPDDGPAPEELSGASRPSGCLAEGQAVEARPLAAVRFAEVGHALGQLVTGDTLALPHWIQQLPREELFGLFASESRVHDRYPRIRGHGRRYADVTTWHGALADLDTVAEPGADRPAISAELVAAADRMLSELRATGWYPSPRGVRVVLVYKTPVLERTLAAAAARAAWRLLGEGLRARKIVELDVDPCTVRVVQVHRGPGSERVRWTGHLIDPVKLAELDPGPEAVEAATKGTVEGRLRAPRPARTRVGDEPPEFPWPELRRNPYPPHANVFHASRAFAAAHPIPFSSGPGVAKCPACGSWSGFGLSGKGDRWVCFSTRHPSSVGRRDQNGASYFGTMLDLFGARAGVKKGELLRQLGWLRHDE